MWTSDASRPAPRGQPFHMPPRWRTHARGRAGMADPPGLPPGSGGPRGPLPGRRRTGRLRDRDFGRRHPAGSRLRRDGWRSDRRDDRVPRGDRRLRLAPRRTDAPHVPAEGRRDGPRPRPRKPREDERPGGDSTLDRGDERGGDRDVPKGRLPRGRSAHARPSAGRPPREERLRTCRVRRCLVARAPGVFAPPSDRWLRGP